MKLMEKLIQFCRAHSVGVYFLMAFALPWIPSFFIAGPKFFRGEDIELLSILIGVAMFLAPILSSILMTYIVDGKLGIGQLFSRMKLWRMGKWYLTLLIFPILISVLSFALSVTVSPDFAPVFLIGKIMMGISAGFLEELGWMGFAFPKMREKHGLIRASIYLGLIHGLWHFPLWFLYEYSTLGAFWFPYFIAFAAILVALRIIIAWAYSKTNSLLLVQLIHASSTGFLFVLTPEYVEPVNEAIFYALYAVCLWLVALVAIRKMSSPLEKQI